MSFGCTHHSQELGKALGEVWRNLSDKEKQPYATRAKTDREHYENDLCAIGRQAAAAVATGTAATTTTVAVKGKGTKKISTQKG